jgi:hypothetical protein
MINSEDRRQALHPPLLQDEVRLEWRDVPAITEGIGQGAGR